MLNTDANTDVDKNVEKRRLAWRCRRGLLELDIVLQRFITYHFNDLNEPELVAFDGLLAMPDNEFWCLLQTKQMYEDAAKQSVINKLNAT